MRIHLNNQTPPRWVSWGRLDFFSETGTEGGYWAIQSSDPFYSHKEEDLVDRECPWKISGCPVALGYYHTHSKYEGLRILKDDDAFIIHSEDFIPILTVNSLKLSEFTVFEESALGFRTHNHPISPDIPVSLWMYLFLKELPAMLATKEFPFGDEEGYRLTNK